MPFELCKIRAECAMLLSGCCVDYVYKWQCINSCSVCYVIIYVLNSFAVLCQSSKEGNVLSGWCSNFVGEV